MAIIMPYVIGSTTVIVQTKVFDLHNGKYSNLSDLARAMEISVSQVYRVREGKRNINQSFIVGAIKAFPEYRFDDLFYFTAEPEIRIKKNGE